MPALNLNTINHSGTSSRHDRFRASLESALFEPIRSVLESPGKKLRAQLVCCLVDSFLERRAGDSNLIKKLISDIIEQLHAASIIIDDIEDSSEERRGKPTLHRQLGIPLALNAGCWQLFAPFECIKVLNLKPEVELRVFRATQETILIAHEGQAVDLSSDATEVQTSEVYDLWMQIAQRKTGALLELAAKLPFLVRGYEFDYLAAAKFGNDFGVALQMFDDISDFFNLDGISDDLKNRRLNWGQVCAADTLSSLEFAELCFNLKFIESRKSQFDTFVKQHKLKSIATKRAIYFLDSAFKSLKNSKAVRSDDCWKDLFVLKEKLIHAYI